MKSKRRRTLHLRQGSEDLDWIGNTQQQQYADHRVHGTFFVYISYLHIKLHFLSTLRKLWINLTGNWRVHQQRDKEREADIKEQGPAPREPINLCRDSFPLAWRVCAPLASSLPSPASACPLSASVTSSSNLIYQPCLLKLMPLYNSYVCSKRYAAAIMFLINIKRTCLYRTYLQNVPCQHLSLSSTVFAFVTKACWTVSWTQNAQGFKNRTGMTLQVV